MVAISIGVIAGWPTGFPVWAYFICLLIPVLWLIPIGVVQAITNIQLGLNVLTEFIIGYMVPGRPMAMMMFKNYGYICMGQALYFAQDLKLGHYMKVPPRVMFSSQLVASIWSAIVQICVMNWALGHIPDVCAVDQPNNYTCPGGRVFYTASVIWGGHWTSAYLQSWLNLLIAPVVLAGRCCDTNHHMAAGPQVASFNLAIRQYPSYLRGCWYVAPSLCIYLSVLGHGRCFLQPLR